MNDWKEGVFYAASILVELRDEPTMAADILEQAGLLSSDISDLDETEKNAMIRLQKEDERCVFVGIDD